RDLAGADVVGDQAHVGLEALRDCHDDAVDAVVVLERLQARGHQSAFAGLYERLGTIAAEPLPRTGGDDDHPGLEHPHPARRLKIILPDGLCSTLVTSTSTVSPSSLRPASITIIVPSLR